MSSHYGERLKISIFGQSHSPAIGVSVDGLPEGFALDMDELRAFMRRRAPGQGELATARVEEDMPEVLSGLVNGVTCGAPLAIVIRNTDARSADYREVRDIPRPSHADYAAHMKYGGHQDVAGGGHFSGRLTAPLCAAGGVCLQILPYTCRPRISMRFAAQSPFPCSAKAREPRCGRKFYARRKRATP